MHAILKKAHSAIKNTQGFNLEDVFSKEQSKRMYSKYYFFDLLVDSRNINTVSDMLKRYQRVEMNTDEAEWVMAFLRAYGQLQERVIPPDVMAGMVEQMGIMDECDCDKCNENVQNSKDSSNSMEVV